MSQRCATATLAVLLSGASACGNDAPKAETRAECVSAAGPLIECDPVPLAGAEDACWRLVQCGAIPVANPESEPDRGFDWSTCVDFIERLPDQRFELALACIESSACNELKPRAGQARATRPTGPPVCLDQGQL